MKIMTIESNGNMNIPEGTVTGITFLNAEASPLSISVPREVMWLNVDGSITISEEATREELCEAIEGLVRMLVPSRLYIYSSGNVGIGTSTPNMC
jgi:hypothetical protein